jgi:uncharacterized membrane protein
MDIKRICRHLLAEGSGRRHFPQSTRTAIQQAIAAGERTHAGQVCIAIEGALPLSDLLHGRTSRERAAQVFAHLRVWDTERNCGVLIYVLLPDRAIEIIADRGITARVDARQWQDICIQMQECFAAGEFERGAVEGIHAVSALLAQHFPGDAASRPNELPDQPVLL